MSTNKHNFEPEWVTEVYYGNSWHLVKPRSYESLETKAGTTHYYADPYSGETVFINVVIQGYKFKQPEEAQVIQLHDDL